jgi:hypothetical protein
MNSQVDQRIGLGYSGLNLLTLAESGEKFKG